MKLATWQRDSKHLSRLIIKQIGNRVLFHISQTIQLGNEIYVLCIFVKCIFLSPRIRSLPSLFVVSAEGI